ncbi:MAG: hypothetical protein ACFFCQ_02290 [Promethearchaeota archaeon]
MLMRKKHKGEYCQYYTEMSYCTVLKIDLLTCPAKCAFFRVRDITYKPNPELLEDCRFLQHEGVLDICLIKGDSVESCNGCQKFDSIENHIRDPTLEGYI